jgi:HD-GYP domain-containing protein (c-di-GMP phosphodiesterase class II)
MVPRFKLLTAALVVSSAVAATALLQSTHLNIGTREFIGLLLFFVIYIVFESQPLELPGQTSRITISGLSTYALVALFPPLYAATVGAAAVLIVERFLERKSPLKILFNTTQIFLSILGAAFIYNIVKQSELNSHIPANIVAISSAVVAYFLINTGIVSLGLSLLKASSFWRTWTANYSWEVLYVIGTIPIAVLLILAYERLWIGGPTLFLAPLFLLREAYAQYIRLKRTYTETVRTLIKVIETHDTYTAGHSLRVAEYAKRLGIAKRLSVKEVEKIEIGAYLHDLGKVDLAITHLVRKPGRLTHDEKRRVQLHPLVSADLAAQVTYFKGDIEDIIRHHHEHYNGTGYPHGLKGAEIPLGSRIILIADAFDAMTSTRKYRGALDFDKVVLEFRRFSGVQFDPELVDLFLTVCVKDASMLIPQIEIPEELIAGVHEDRDDAVTSKQKVYT